MTKPPSSSGPSGRGVRLLTLIALATIPTFFFESRSALPISSGVGVRPSRSVRTVETRRHFESRLTM